MAGIRKKNRSITGVLIYLLLACFFGIPYLIVIPTIASDSGIVVGLLLTILPFALLALFIVSRVEKPVGNDWRPLVWICAVLCLVISVAGVAQFVGVTGRYYEDSGYQPGRVIKSIYQYAAAVETGIPTGLVIIFASYLYPLEPRRLLADSNKKP